jgi:hypothetical protein
VVDPFVEGKRLASPQHYRYYFAFSQPVGSLRDGQVQAFIDTAECSVSDAIGMFAELAQQGRPQGGRMAEVLVDRLGASSDRIPSAAIPGIFASFANSMDDIAKRSAPESFGEYAAWRTARRVVGALLKSITEKPDIRRTSLRSLFEGRALGWLSDLLRGEIFAHERASPPEQRLLSNEEFDWILSVMLGRYREATDLVDTPYLLNLLYVWLQGSGKKDTTLKAWIERQTASDAGFLQLLSTLRGWSVSSHLGAYRPLRAQTTKYFLDHAGARQRVERISESTTASEAELRLASELLVAFRQGESDEH